MVCSRNGHVEKHMVLLVTHSAGGLCVLISLAEAGDCSCVQSLENIQRYCVCFSVFAPSQSSRASPGNALRHQSRSLQLSNAGSAEFRMVLYVHKGEMQFPKSVKYLTRFCYRAFAPVAPGRARLNAVRDSHVQRKQSAGAIPQDRGVRQILQPFPVRAIVQLWLQLSCHVSYKRTADAP